MRYATYSLLASKEDFDIMAGSMASPWVGGASDVSPTAVNKENPLLVICAHWKFPIVFDKFPITSYGVSGRVIMNLEAEEMEQFTPMLNSHELCDEVCSNSFDDGLKHGC
jgi:hypothetical protein